MAIMAIVALGAWPVFAGAPGWQLDPASVFSSFGTAVTTPSPVPQIDV